MNRVLDSGHYRLRALLAFLLISGFLGLVLWKNETARSTGAEIILETQPIDPRDMFFGNYATLSYNISRNQRDYFALMDPVLQQRAKERWRTRQDVLNWWRSDEPAYVLFENNDGFDRPSAIISNTTSMDPKTDTWLTATWNINQDFRCADDLMADDNCWYITLNFDLPNRYYADPETAMALQERIGEAQRVQREQREFEACEEARANATVLDPVPELCADIIGPPEEARDFGIILSVSEAGEAVIKGVYIDGRKIYDTLTGPRITVENLE